MTGDRSCSYIAPRQSTTPAEALAAAAAVRERRKSLFFRPAPRPVAKAPQPEKVAKPIAVPSLAEKFEAALAASPILKATTVNGSIIAKDGVISSAYTIEAIQRAICLVSGCPKNDMLGQRRQKHIVEPRQIAMYLAKRHTQRSLPDIGRRFGGKDHTTVLHAIRKYEWMHCKLPPDGRPITEIAEAAWGLFQAQEAEKSAA